MKPEGRGTGCKDIAGFIPSKAAAIIFMCRAEWGSQGLSAVQLLAGCVAGLAQLLTGPWSPWLLLLHQENLASGMGKV